jgi:hypothetical protein
MKHEVFYVNGDQAHTDGLRGLEGLHMMALEIREAYDQTAKNGGRIIAAHTVAFQLSANPENEVNPDEVEGECLFLVAEVPDDSTMGESDTEYVGRT